MEQTDFADSVTLIGNSVFYENKLTLVVIPNSVTSIGQEAFRSNKLTSIVIPNSVTSIGKNAFEDNQLKEVILPKAWYYTRSNVFSINITGVKFYEYNTSKRGNKDAEFSSSTTRNPVVTTTRDGSTITTNTDGTRHLIIGNGVKTIGDRAFRYNQLTSVTIPNSVTSIEDYAFAYNQLTKVILPGALYDKRGDAFDWNPAGLKFYDYDASKYGKKGRYVGVN